MHVKLSAYFLACKKCSVSFVFHCCHKGHSVIDDNPFWTVCNLLGQIFFFLFNQKHLCNASIILIYGAWRLGKSWEKPCDTFGAKCLEYWDPPGTFPVLMGDSWMSQDARKREETKHQLRSGNNFGIRNGGSFCWHFLTSFPDKTFVYLSSGLLWWWDARKELCNGQS